MECYHERIVFSNPQFHCVNCGCVIPNIGQAPIVDPNYFTSIEISPMELFKDMKNCLLRIDQKSKLKNPEYLEARRTLIEWIFNASSKLNLSKRTSHLAALYTDLILMPKDNSLHSDKYHTIALCCLIIATKFIELDIKLPYFRDFIKASKIEIERFVIQDTEINLLRLLDWNLRVPTVYEIIMNFLTGGILFPYEHCQKEFVNRVHSKLISHYISLFIELIITEKEFLNYDFVILASSIIYVARRASGIEEEWNEKLIGITGMTLIDFHNCKEWIMIKYKDILEKSSLMNYDLISIFSEQQNLNIPKIMHNNKFTNSSCLIKDPLIKNKPHIGVNDQISNVENDKLKLDFEKINNSILIINEKETSSQKPNSPKDLSVINLKEQPTISNLELISKRINPSSLVK